MDIMWSKTDFKCANLRFLKYKVFLLSQKTKIGYLVIIFITPYKTKIIVVHKKVNESF